VLVPHLLDRPLVFDRYPDGIHGEHFYQKDAHDYTGLDPTEKIWSPDVERHIRHFIGADRDQFSAITGAMHRILSSRVQFIECMDFVIFDLDPVDVRTPCATGGWY
jgi:bifunctional non-homologous end joining protein LigD